MLASPSIAAKAKGLFALNAQVHLKPDRREEFLEIIQYDAEETILQEKGAVQFTVGQSTTDSTIFHFHERYQSRKDFEDHQATKHFLKFKAFCETDPFASDVIIQEYYLITPSIEFTPKAAASDKVLCLNAELCVKESLRAEFLSLIQNNQRASLSTEPLCRQFVYGESITTPNLFYFHEQYSGEEQGQEGFRAHQATPHFQVWKEFVEQNPFTKAPVADFFQTIFNERK